MERYNKEFKEDTYIDNLYNFLDVKYDEIEKIARDFNNFSKTLDKSGAPINQINRHKQELLRISNELVSIFNKVYDIIKKLSN